MGIIDYIKETEAEVHKVSWPTTQKTTWLSIIVVAISILVAAYLGLFDFIFARLLEGFIL